MANKPLRGINFPGLEDTYMTAGYPTENGGEIFNDYKNNKILNNSDWEYHAHAEGCQTEAGWRSHSEGHLTLADNNSHAEGKLAKATGKGAHAEGYGGEGEILKGVVDGEVYYSSIGTMNDITIDSKSFTIDVEYDKLLQFLSKGDIISLKPTDSMKENFPGFKNTDSKRITGIFPNDDLGLPGVDIILETPFRDANYYEGHNCPEDGILPAGMILSKSTFNLAADTGSHAEGYSTQALGIGSHSEGVHTTAKNEASHAEGRDTKATNTTAHAEGNSTISSGFASHAEGNTTKALNNNAHAEGYNTQALGAQAHAEGSTSIAEGNNSHAEGQQTLAKGTAAHSEGMNTKSYSIGGHSEGYDTQAGVTPGNPEITGDSSCAHAEGASTKAYAYSSHAEGNGTTASGSRSHAEGFNSTASGSVSHAEGNGTTASGQNSHGEGLNTVASGNQSHAEGWRTKAASENQHVQGKCNIEDTANEYAHIVGNGTSDTNRSNAHTLDWNGNAWFAGTMEAAGIILTSPNGSKFKITIDNDGNFISNKL